VLACSVTPVLNAIGSTVALGSVCALLCAALWARPRTPVAAR
jgi:predicted exporter